MYIYYEAKNTLYIRNLECCKQCEIKTEFNLFFIGGISVGFRVKQWKCYAFSAFCNLFTVRISVKRLNGFTFFCSPTHLLMPFIDLCNNETRTSFELTWAFGSLQAVKLSSMDHNFG